MTEISSFSDTLIVFYTLFALSRPVRRKTSFETKSASWCVRCPSRATAEPGKPFSRGSIKTSFHWNIPPSFVSWSTGRGLSNIIATIFHDRWLSRARELSVPSFPSTGLIDSYPIWMYNIYTWFVTVASSAYKHLLSVIAVEFHEDDRAFIPNFFSCIVFLRKIY